MDVISPHDPIIFLLMRRFRVPSHDRDDLAQECRLAVLEGDDAGSDAFWLILRRCATWMRRRINERERWVCMSELDIGRNMLDVMADPPDISLGLEVRELLDRLKPSWARYLWLSAIGWTGKEIGAMEGLGRGAIKHALALAREEARHPGSTHTGPPVPLAVSARSLEVVKLRDGGHTYEMIGRKMGFSAPRARFLYNQARARLRA